MASRSLLIDKTLTSELRQLLRASFIVVSEDSTTGQDLQAQHQGAWLTNKALAILQALPDWEASRPLMLGSLARQELCPLSDLDVLFLGPEENVKNVTSEALKRGVRLRGRVPENPDLWSLAAGAEGELALLDSHFLEGGQQGLEIKERLLSQQQKILRGRRRLFQYAKGERNKRLKRHGSLIVGLEPNIKYGAGGLRDLRQLQQFFRLYPERLQELEWQLELQQHTNFLLWVRQMLQVLGGGEVISRDLHIEMAGEVGSSPGYFSKKLMLVMERVLQMWGQAVFVIDSDRRSRRIIFKKLAWPTQKLIDEAISKPSAATSLALSVRLNKDPLSQTQERHTHKSQTQERHTHKSQTHKSHTQSGVKKINLCLWDSPSADAIAVGLKKYFSTPCKMSDVREFFDSGLAKVMLPNFIGVSGLVQFDHYHKFPVHSHLRLCVELAVKLARPLKRRRGIFRLTQNFTAEDWEILILTALFHDLGKGLGGDHSRVGARFVCELFANQQSPASDEVAWMVENHLILSTAAFRRNPQDPKTWTWLGERGLSEARMKRLAVFTALDIQATNPDAWNSWKEKLLWTLAQSYLSKEARGVVEFQRGLGSIKAAAALGYEFDFELLGHLGAKVALQDLKSLLNLTPPSSVRISVASKGRLWVRFFEKQDREGLFLEFVTRLYAAQANIVFASVQTIEGFGAYDWFLVKSNLGVVQMKKALALDGQRSPIKGVFDRISRVSQTEDECVLSFKGKDQPGLLMVAALALQSAGLNVRWAKAQTWGRQVDDVFSVRGAVTDETLDRLIKEFTGFPTYSP